MTGEDTRVAQLSLILCMAVCLTSGMFNVSRALARLSHVSRAFKKEAFLICKKEEQKQVLIAEIALHWPALLPSHTSTLSSHKGL